MADHIILGSGGAISRALVPELARREKTITLVSRRGLAPSGTTGVAADLRDPEAVRRVVTPGSVVYLLAGFAYDSRVWEATWPVVMENVISACRETDSLLVFFDNVYMYGLVDGPMTEATPHRPRSRKGRVRAQVAETVEHEMHDGHLRAVIARSADFYGPGAGVNGIPNVMILQRLRRGKPALWPVRGDRPHSFTYTRDCGRALALLAEDTTAHNRVWHLPTAAPPLTVREFAEVAAQELGVQPRLNPIPGWVFTVGGIAYRLFRELSEMQYQNRYDYVFDSSAFQRHFAFEPTPYQQGIRETLETVNR